MSPLPPTDKETAPTGAVSETTLTEEAFVERFRPRVNHLNSQALIDFGDGGTMFETYGEDLAFIREQNPAQIWTLLDGDEGLWLVSGPHFVNRLGYVLCENPVPEREAYEVQL